MALSKNLNQVKRFGSLFDISSTDPRNALKFWLAANSQAMMRMQEYPDRTCVLRFEELCEDPASSISALAHFLGFSPTLADIQRFSSYIRRPDSIDRYRGQSLAGFDQEDLSELRNFGYTI